MSTLGRVAVIGAGQMGTLLGMALRETVDEVVLADRDPDALQASLERNAAHRTVSVEEALDADAVVLAVPLPEIVALVETLGPRFREGSLVIDTGSAKGRVVEAMSRHVPVGVPAIGGHPMAGTEVPGPAGADPARLRHATFALTPVREDPIAILRATALAEAVGARPRVVDAAEHDRVVARTSHLPHVLAFALSGLVLALPEEGVRDLAASGFDGATRLAASDPGMVAGFLGSNADEVRASIGELRDRLAEVERALDTPEELARLLDADAEGRRRAVE